MLTRKTEFGYLLRLETGDELVEKLVEFCKKEQIVGAELTVIGAAKEITLGFYALEKKEYHWKDFVGEFEITGGVGNISLLDGVPMLHLHTSIADEKFNAFGGHVKRLIVGATCEVLLRTFKGPLERKMDETAGLNLWGL